MYAIRSYYVAAGRDLGVRESFADVAATVAAAFGLDWTAGRSLLRDLAGESREERARA